MPGTRAGTLIICHLSLDMIGHFSFVILQGLWARSLKLEVSIPSQAR